MCFRATKETKIYELAAAKRHKTIVYGRNKND